MTLAMPVLDDDKSSARGMIRNISKKTSVNQATHDGSPCGCFHRNDDKQDTTQAGVIPKYKKDHVIVSDSQVRRFLTLRKKKRRYIYMYPKY